MQVITEREDGTRRVQTFFDRDKDKVNGPSRSRVKPEFLKETRIDVIMKKALRSGVVTVRPGSFFGDFTNGADFLTTQNRIIGLQKYFDSLPSETRDFFANDPKNLLDFVLDPKNKEQAIELGLLQADKKPVPPREPDPRAVTPNPPPVPPVDVPVPPAPGA